jgi:hypothetical protein
MNYIITWVKRFRIPAFALQATAGRQGSGLGNANLLVYRD